MTEDEQDAVGKIQDAALRLSLEIHKLNGLNMSLHEHDGRYLTNPDLINAHDRLNECVMWAVRYASNDKLSPMKTSFYK